MTLSDDNLKEWALGIALREREQDKFGVSTSDGPCLWEAMEKLAELQQQYDAGEEDFDRRLSAAAARVLLPLCNKDKDRVRELLWFSARSAGWPFRLNVTPRRPKELPTIVRARQRRQTKETADEIIGLAVLRVYRSLPPDTPGKLVEAINRVAEMGTVGGITVGGADGVAKRYKEFSQLARKRGYADTLMFVDMALSGQPGADRVWLADFPRRGAKSAN